MGNKRFEQTLPGLARTPAFAQAEEEQRRSLVPEDDSIPSRDSMPDIEHDDEETEPSPSSLDYDDDAPSTIPDRMTPLPAEVVAAGLTEGDRTSGEYRIATADDEIKRQHAERYLRRGRRALADGDRQAAIKHFEKALAKDPHNRVAKAALAKARRG